MDETYNSDSGDCSSEDTKTFNPTEWWAGMAEPDDFSTLFQFAPDTLCYSAMLIECERVFSSTKNFITPERNALAEDIIEAYKCIESLREEQLDWTAGRSYIL